MSRDWKPGDVVAATVNGRQNVRLIAGWSKYDPQLRWGELSPRWADGDDDGCWWMPSQVTAARRLVVIDPEDRVQIERLVDGQSLRGYGMRDLLVDRLQDALREFADPKPLKPAEPTGLGAVVEDADGVRWILVYDYADEGERRWAKRGGVSTASRWRPYADIAAVRVLSEGVTA